MTEVLVAIIVLISGVVTMLLGFWGSRKFHIGPSQEMLVRTLQAVIDAQTERIKQLESQIAEQTIRIAALNQQICELTTKVDEMEAIIVGQARQIHDLEQQ